MIPSPLLPLLALAAAAAAPALPTPDTESLVLVVASNRGIRLDRAPLQYADDDGAKYHHVFSAIAGPENTILLTDFDADTAGLFPALAATSRPPTLANVQATVRELARRAAVARSQGRAVRFYFVFAGHGDVDEGRGFLELSDGPFTADQLQELIATIGPTEGHVILDSCNSFFVVNPRKSGGQRFATPRDAAERLAQRLPNVGVFLSTSALAEVFEWSELQSGVFSHAVRSGLMGAADVDHDGRVSYQELAGFVETSAADIKNPLFRPKVFARGPNGEDGRPLLALPRSPRAVLIVDGPEAIRLATRDREGLRWLDAFKEAGDRLELWYPAAIEGELEVERLRSAGGDSAMERRYALPAERGERIALGALAPASSPLASRGAGEIFRALFARPYGPGAYATWLAARTPQVEPDLPSVEAGAVAAPAPSRVELAHAAPVAVEPAVAPAGIVGDVVEPMPSGPGSEPTASEARPTSVSLRIGGMMRKPPFETDTGKEDDEPVWDALGSDWSVAVSRAFRPWFEGELALGHHSTRSDPSPFKVPGDTYVGRSLTSVVVTEQVTPVELSLRLVQPRGRFHLHLLVGVGLALAHVTFDPRDGNPTLRTTRFVPEAHFGLGATLDVRDRWFAGGEARFSFARVNFIAHELGLEGLRFGALVGRRF